MTTERSLPKLRFRHYGDFESLNHWFMGQPTDEDTLLDEITTAPQSLVLSDSRLAQEQLLTRLKSRLSSKGEQLISLDDRGRIGLLRSGERNGYPELNHLLASETVEQADRALEVLEASARKHSQRFCALVSGSYEYKAHLAFAFDRLMEAGLIRFIAIGEQMPPRGREPSLFIDRTPVYQIAPWSADDVGQYAPELSEEGRRQIASKTGGQQDLVKLIVERMEGFDAKGSNATYLASVYQTLVLQELIVSRPPFIEAACERTLAYLQGAGYALQFMVKEYLMGRRDPTHPLVTPSTLLPLVAAGWLAPNEQATFGMRSSLHQMWLRSLLPRLCTQT